MTLPAPTCATCARADQYARCSSTSWPPSALSWRARCPARWRAAGAVLPCGADLDRFRRSRARGASARPATGRAVPPVPGRSRAGGQALRPRAEAAVTRDPTLGAFIPSSAALRQRRQRRARPSAHEGFGLAAWRRRVRRACARYAGRGAGGPGRVAGTLCAPFDGRRGGPPRAPPRPRSSHRRPRPGRARVGSGDGSTGARRLGRGATVARRGAEFGCRFRMKGPLQSSATRRRPAAGSRPRRPRRKPDRAQPGANLASSRPAASDQAASGPRRGPAAGAEVLAGQEPSRPPEPASAAGCPAPALPAPRASWPATSAASSSTSTASRRSTRWWTASCTR